MNDETSRKEGARLNVLSLIEQAEEAETPDQAMKYAQAALNAAHALETLASVERGGDRD